MASLADYRFAPVTDDLLSRLHDFSCHYEADLATFFREKAVVAAKGLMSKSYCFYDPKTNDMVAAFCVLNAVLSMEQLSNYAKRSVNKKIGYEKQRKQYPATLIGQLVVFDNYESLHLGDELMSFILAWITANAMQMGNRFLVVDAINHKKVIDYYIRNHFTLLFRTEEEEKEAIGKDIDSPLDTRMMFFDLLNITM